MRLELSATKFLSDYPKLHIVQLHSRFFTTTLLIFATAPCLTNHYTDVV